MQELRGQVFRDLRLEAPRTVGGISLVRCTFDNCFASGGLGPDEMPRLRQVSMRECRVSNGSLNATIIEHIIVDRLDVIGGPPRRLLIFFSCFFRHVMLRGRIEGLKGNIDTITPIASRPKDRSSGVRHTGRFMKQRTGPSTSARQNSQRQATSISCPVTSSGETRRRRSSSRATD
jgi:hypothetical protein